jgi:glycosyltransferase involved in cell wall biosynthesis
VYFARAHAEALRQPHDLLLASSYLPLAELLALCPWLHDTPRVLYFHENQLAYPVRDEFNGARDMHFGFSQMISCLAATHCVFNSRWNRDSFLQEARTLLSRMPDAVPPGWVDDIQARSSVLPVPLLLRRPSQEALRDPSEGRERGPVLLWNHRWEYDKAPEDFFAALKALVQREIPFRVVVCGQRFRKAPPIFDQARQWLGDRVLHWGYAQDRAAYEALLERSHIAISTAQHEFFGVSMVEAAHHGAYALAPARLSYPEIFPKQHLYADQDALIERLSHLCTSWTRGDIDLRGDFTPISAPWGATLLSEYQETLQRWANGGAARAQT